MGTDILFLVSKSGSWGCYREFRKLLEQKYQNRVRVHPVCDVYEGVHVDTTICVVGYNKKLEKNLVVVNGTRVNPKNMPAIFRGKNWAILEVFEVDAKNIGYEDFTSNCTEFIVMNFLSLSEDLILMDIDEKRLRKALEFYGI
ncbi:MAG: hypothetical protein E6Q33_04425 [Neisseriales bacterium]|nr:MAG: hypothetical protein E6Q33_04425 [Neisseriales bacterium]